MSGVTDYYRDTQALYDQWSPQGHLHHGYFRIGDNPFARRLMLDAMSDEVIASMCLAHPRSATIADLGCGLAQTSMRASRTYPGLQAYAFTISPDQARLANRTHCPTTQGRVHVRCRDFRQTGLADVSVDGAFALESACYATGPDKLDLLTEMHRILKPEAKLCIVDGFLLRPFRAGGLGARLLAQVHEGWQLDSFPQRERLTQALQQLGMVDINVRELGWRIAPSALHGPWLAARALRHKRTGIERKHLRSGLLGLALGLRHRHFRYLMVTARKPTVA